MSWLLLIFLGVPVLGALLLVVALATGLIHEPAELRQVARAWQASWNSLYRP